MYTRGKHKQNKVYVDSFPFPFDISKTGLATKKLKYSLTSKISLTLIDHFYITIFNELSNDTNENESSGRGRPFLNVKLRT